MLRRDYIDRDGKCFALAVDESCSILKKNKQCGSYRCPFYKPKDMRDWVKLERNGRIYLIEPEETENVRDEIKQETDKFKAKR